MICTNLKGIEIIQKESLTMNNISPVQMFHTESESTFDVSNMTRLGGGQDQST